MIGWYDGSQLPSRNLGLLLINRRASLVFAVQTWLAQTPEQANKSGTPGWMSAGMAGVFCSGPLDTLCASTPANPTALLAMALGTVRIVKHRIWNLLGLTAGHLDLYLSIYASAAR